MALISDGDLLNGVVQRDEQAFLSLYDRYSIRVYALILRMVQNEQTAEEITQDVFYKLWSQAYRFDAALGGFAPWLLTIARNAALDRLRLENRRPFAPNEFDPEETWNLLSDEKSNTDEARWRSLFFAIRSLPEEQRLVIELAYYHGMSHREIGEELGIPVGTVKTRMRYGMDQLRKLWLEQDPENEKSNRPAPDVIQ